jgi:hypothetical protein
MNRPGAPSSQELESPGIPGRFILRSADELAKRQAASTHRMHMDFGRIFAWALVSMQPHERR